MCFFFFLKSVSQNFENQLLASSYVPFCPSILLSLLPPHRTMLALDGFSWNVINIGVFFSRIRRENTCYTENVTQITSFWCFADREVGQLLRKIKRVTLNGDPSTFMITYRSILLRMRIVSDKSCRKNQNTHFMFNNTFFSRKSCCLWDNVEKCSRTGQATDNNMTHANCVVDNWG
jgi:hypothetical protein